MKEFDLNFYAGKRVFVTGHTGFKGSWLCKLLRRAGAEVTGYSLNPPTEPSLFALAGIEGEITSVIGDIRDFSALKAAFDACDPDVVFHLAAQKARYGLHQFLLRFRQGLIVFLQQQHYTAHEVSF